MALSSCSKPEQGPVLTQVEPDRGPGNVPVEVTITGERLRPRLFTDFSRAGSSTLEDSWTARLGREPLQDVRLIDGAVRAVVPAGLPAGRYDVVVVDPHGLALTLADGYQVLPYGEEASLVAGYRFLPVGPQRARVSFEVTVTAVDASGSVVPAFNGNTSLSDLTGTAVPRTLTSFVRGRWVGPVEVRTTTPSTVLTVTDSRGRRGSSNAFEVGVGLGSALRFATPGRTLQAGACSEMVTVEVADSVGSLSPVSSSTALDLSVTPGAGAALFTDSGCATRLRAPVLPAGAASISFYVRHTRAGTHSLRASAQGLLSAVQSLRVVPGPVAALAFVTVPHTVTASLCSPTVTVETRDAHGNATAVAAGLDVSWSASPTSGFRLFTASDCATETTLVQIPAGRSQASVAFRGTTAGVVTLTASAPGLTPASQQARITPEGFATKLAIVSSPQRLAVNVCSGPIAVQSQDSQGNAVTNPSAISALLTSTPAGALAFFSDAQCTVPSSALRLGVTTSVAVGYFVGAQPGSIDIHANAAGLVGDSQVQSLVAGAAAALVVASPPQTLSAGLCSGEVAVQVEDAQGFATTVGADTQVSWSASPAAGFTLYSDSGCSAAITATTIAANTGSTRAYFRGDQAGQVTLTVSAPSLGAASQVETIGAGPPAALEFRTPAQSVVAGACSGVATVALTDAFGNTSPTSSARQITLSVAPGGAFTFFSDPGCGTPAGALAVPPQGTSASFYFRAVSTGLAVVTASSPGLISADQTETLLPGSPFALAFTGAPLTVNAGDCSPAVGLEVRDALGHPSPVAASTAIDLAATPAAGLSFFTESSCATVATAVPVAPGSSSATLYFRSTRAGAVVLGVSATGLTSASQTQTVATGPSTQLVFTTPPRTVTAGGCSSNLDLAVQDAFGNLVAQATPRALALSASPASGFAFFTDAACAQPASSVSIPPASSGASVWVRGTSAANVSVTAQSPGLLQATQTVTVSAAATPTQLVFTTPPRSVTSGQCSASLSVQTRDSFGNPRAVGAPTSVALSVSPATGMTFFSDASCSTGTTSVPIAAGSDNATFYVRGARAGGASVTADAPPLSPATQPITVDAAPPARLLFVSPSQTLPAGVCSAVATVETQDAQGNPSGPSSATAVTLSGGAGVTFFSDPGCSSATTTATVAAGATRASFYFRGVIPGPFTLGAAASGLTPASQLSSIVAGNPARLVFLTGPITIKAGSCSTGATVEVQDAFGNPAAVGSDLPVALSQTGVSVTFFSGTCGSATTSLIIPAGSSRTTFTFRGNSTGTVRATASAAGLTSASQDETLVPGDPVRYAFVTAAQTLSAGTCSNQAVVELRDAFGNASPAVLPTTVTLSALPSSGFTFHPAAGCSSTTTSVTMGAGASQVSFFMRGTRAATVTVTAGDGILVSATQSEVVSAGPAAAFSWDPVPPTVTAGAALAVTIRALDAFGNQASSFTGTATLSIAPAGSTVTCVAPCTNASTTDAFGGGVWAGTVTPGGATGPGRALTATQGALSGTSASFTLQSPAARAPPVARFTALPRLLFNQTSATFDASSSSDLQSPTSALEVSWDFSGVATSSPGAAPWTPWTTTKTAVNGFTSTGIFGVRLAVRDPDGDIAYTVVWIHVLPPGSPNLCTINTSSMTDDGATNCSLRGPDGLLSLAEAARVSNDLNGRQTFTFSQPMTITGSGPLSLAGNVDFVGFPGVLLVGVVPTVASNNALARFYGVEFSGQATPVDVSGNASLEFYDAYLHDFAGVSARQAVVLEGTTVASCTGPCVVVTTGGRATVRYSTFRNSTQPALRIASCSTTPLDVYATTFDGVSAGVVAECPGTLLIRNNTFNNVSGTAVSLSGGTGQVLVNNIFTNSAGPAVTCGTATFSSRRAHLLYNVGSAGCVATDPATLLVDPQYIAAGSGDLRLGFGSPAINTGDSLGIRLVNGGPGNFLGVGPDRGGRETY